jgi:cytochrome c biogenesis protein CcmG/thiol:disulfide interchange protein DsbE
MRIKSFRAWIADRGRWIALTILVLVSGAAWTAASAAQPSSMTGGRVPSPRQGFLAPEFTVERSDGGTWMLSEARGDGVILNFWASWCPPCRAEMPALERVHNDLADEGIQVVALNVTRQDSESAAKAFAADLGLSLPIGLDRTGEIERLYQVRALPTTFFIDADGVIRSVVIGGPMREAVLRAEAEALLEEPTP